jgi:hypothetical protein
MQNSISNTIIESVPVEVSKRESAVVIRFSDGLRAIFLPYSHGFGYQIEGLQRFGIEDAYGKLLVEYDARLYRCGPQENEHKIVHMEEGWSIPRIVAYWEAAKKYCAKLFYGKTGFPEIGVEPNQEWWYVWRVTQEGWIDLDALKNQIGTQSK